MQPAVGDPASAGGWTGWPTEVPANPDHAGILWFCVTRNSNCHYRNTNNERPQSFHLLFIDLRRSLGILRIIPFPANTFLGLAWDTGVYFLCGLSKLGFVGLCSSLFSDQRGAFYRIMLLGHVSVLLKEVWQEGEEIELIPSQSEGTGNSHGFDCLCLLNVNEGETLKLSFELLLRCNRLGKDIVRVGEPCQYWTCFHGFSTSCLHHTDWVLLPIFGLYNGWGYWSLTPDLKFIF